MNALLLRRLFNNSRYFILAGAFLTLLIDLPLGAHAQTTAWHVISWNNLGMHCMDNDFSVFSILPPYNTIHAQIVWGSAGTAHLVTTDAGYGVSFKAVADPTGSINTTSKGKGNFWTYSPLLLGASLPDNAGVPIPGYGQSFMPGAANTPQPLSYEPSFSWFAAYGIPITPYDDLLRKNSYPLMRVTASNGGTPVAATDIVLPVSDEMDCRACHASGSGPDALPPEGWVWDPSPTRDYRLNILRKHDAVRFQEMPDAYRNLLAATGFNTNGLYASVHVDGRPVFCASCHLSEAVPGTGQPGVPPLTQAIHGLHANVIDPLNGMPLSAVDNRSSCYRCHPGSETRCLRGAMGAAVAADGQLAIQCQSCHGQMNTVASPDRVGWLNEPTCQACHTGDAVSNNGQIRYTSVFSSGDVMRTAVNPRFATSPNTPAEGLSLYRFSSGHGGLQCSACHGSTHAIYPSAHPNDNIASVQFQGHEGTLSECSSCHGSNPNTTFGGPHGMHPLNWVNGHKNPGRTVSNCQPCHGTDNRGTVLSRSFKDQTLSGITFWRGRRIGCYECHNGPKETGQNPPAAPTAGNVSAVTTVNQPVAIPLTASTSLLRIVSQPATGTVGLSGKTATYHPATGFVGTETFTFCADSGYRESNLATVTVTVNKGGSFSYALNTNLAFFDELSHVGTVQVAAGASSDWSVASECQWISILTPGGRVSGSGPVTYSLTRNTAGNARTGTVSIAGLMLTVVQAGTPADVNVDGLPDTWQESHFGTANAANAAPGADPDGDSVSNQDEYLAGTDPDNPASVLRITSFNVATAEQAFQLAFPSVSQHYYQIQRTSDLKSPSWQGFTNAVIGTGGTVPLSGPARVNAPNMFYRVQLVN